MFSLGVIAASVVDIPSSALMLAGFTLAHAAWSVSDTKPEELLVPLAIVEHDGQRTLQRFEAGTQLEAITHGKDATKKLIGGSDAWAFARENVVHESTGPHDLISVDFWTPGMSAPITLSQSFERASSGHGFRIVGQPVVVVGGKVLGSAEAQPYVDVILKGVFSHSKVAPLWPTWK